MATAGTDDDKDTVDTKTVHGTPVTIVGYYVGADGRATGRLIVTADAGKTVVSSESLVVPQELPSVFGHLRFGEPVESRSSKRTSEKQSAKQSGDKDTKDEDKA